jgi:hypothetical protein
LSGEVGLFEAANPESGEKTIFKIDESYEGRDTDTEHKHRLSETVRDKKSMD